MAKRLTKRKAAIMLEEGTVHGQPLTSKQRGLFGIIASGKRPTRVKAPRGKF